ncbi:bacitracin ABC transporter ATP-binding protein [Clostridium carboxidivorans P7]|uniref:ABC transporter related protein n=1 Tax=Clostridium carboxidivorans P7 TaxID=536227 RepID=C6PZ97_9CLOT|nr:ABC transporter ATP-binding protein [Clostridium carboxidivorans]AKN30204.1 bacitracin ABC transporter ATP-binding protein [Clostridium carboxidivorans P7]EET85452.1 ABC transporter related protein [Clostridium carboxidivorans P7]
MNIILKTSNLTKKYKDKVVVNKLNMTINKGDIYGFLGRNGAGKTTTLKMIMGQATANSGSIEIFGETISSSDYKYKSRIGLILENPTFYPKLTAKENLEVYRRSMGVQDKKKIDKVLDLVDLSDEVNKNVEKYSLGMKQRLGMARALLNNPEFLIIDEPTNSLDPVGISQIREIILKLNKERNTTVLICSHILSEIELMATKIGIIHKGNLVEEVLYKELEKTNKSYLQIKVNDQKKASIILEQKFGINEYRIYEDNIIRIFDNSYEPENINKQMIENEVLVKELKVNSEALEDYFFRLTGGEKSV